MPIYDSNGTTIFEIDKVYDNDGTTNHQIGEVYDYNGTTSSLIYTASFYLFQNGLVNGINWTKAGSGYTEINSRILVSEEVNNTATLIYTSTPIDLTEWRTLKAVVSLYGNGWFGGTLGLGVNTTPSTINMPNAHYLASEASNAGVYHTLTVDVSGLTGLYYIFPFAANSKAAGNFHEIWLE